MAGPRSLFGFWLGGAGSTDAPTGGGGARSFFAFWVGGGGGDTGPIPPPSNLTFNVRDRMDDTDFDVFEGTGMGFEVP
jgi:hypothetical protein